MSGERPEPVAHSPPRHDPNRQPQRYRLHVTAVREGARRRAEWALKYATSPPPGFVSTVVAAAVFHDLGKLDEANQGPLSRSRNEPLPRDRDHVDAGIAYSLAQGDEAAAWLVRAHHAPPGIPSYGAEKALPRELRGGRKRDPEEGEHDALITHVDAHLAEYVALHEQVCGVHRLEPAAVDGLHGLPMRLALSCLVDADHSDSAAYDAGIKTPMPGEDRVPTCWAERLVRLEEVVAQKAHDAQAQGRGERVRDRSDFFRACLDTPVDASLATCEGPVGIGKTLAVTGNLLRRAQQTEGRPELRHIFVVAPYTNIITQVVKELRAALVLSGEDPQEVVAEHHHRADFSSPENRGLATLWRAPVIVTTAVQFFETLASNSPGRLRKLHELPGSAVFLDEAHAALPARLWPQNWRWMRELAERWGCRFVFASGSLARFWELNRIVERPVDVPDLLPTTDEGQELHARLLAREGERVRYECLGDGLSTEDLCTRVRSKVGPRLVILNTVQTAALVAKRMRDAGYEVEHLSAALCPRDRERILRRVKARLRLERMVARCAPNGEEVKRLRNWTLVATSLVEAGVDLSFSTAFRERASAASLIQVGGRVNRHRERGGGLVFDFTLSLEEPGVTQNPDWKHARRVLEEMLEDDAINDRDPAEVVTEAIRSELDDLVKFVETLTRAERNRNYPEVARSGQVIEDDTVLVVVDEALRAKLERREKVDSHTLLRLSVQLRRHRIIERGLAQIPHRHEEIYAWGGLYDPNFLGVMEDVFRTDDVFSSEGGVI
jgi:CRISPR-associated endonuclease/helicase Cas3